MIDATVEINANCTLAAVRKITLVFEETLRDVVAEESLASVQLAVAEACANLVRHGSSGREELPLSARMSLEGEEVSVTLVDRGESFDLTETSRVSSLQESASEPQQSGRGIHLIHALMDEVRYESHDGTNTTTLKKHVSRVPLEESWRQDQGTGRAG